MNDAVAAENTPVTNAGLIAVAYDADRLIDAHDDDTLDVVKSVFILMTDEVTAYDDVIAYDAELINPVPVNDPTNDPVNDPELIWTELDTNAGFAVMKPY